MKSNRSWDMHTSRGNMSNMHIYLDTPSHMASVMPISIETQWIHVWEFKYKVSMLSS